MSKRQRRMQQKQRRHERSGPSKRRLAAGAGLMIGATLAGAGTAHAGAGDITVNSSADPGVGVCDGTECTLREAITAANSDATSDDIVFASSLSGSTITLDSSMTSIDYPVRILGPGPGQLTVDGTDNYQLLFISPSSGDDVLVSGLSLTNGSGSSGGSGPNGGAIHTDSADLTLFNIVVSSSTASYQADGGAIGFDSGTLAVQNSTITGNGAVNNNGGAIYNYTGTPVTVQGSTIAYNYATYSGGNSSGGGINGPATIQNSTVYNNYADGNGGGVIGDVTVQNSTITDNSALGDGGGIWSGGTSTLTNSIVANNGAGGSGSNVSGGTFDAAFSLLETTDGATVNDTVGGSLITGQDPQLDPLANNGGPTQTEALAATSPALDKGSGTGTDQRGLPRPFDFTTVANSAAAGANGADIGAFELQGTAAGGGTGGGGTTTVTPPKCKGKTATIFARPGLARTFNGTNKKDVIVGTNAKDTIKAKGGNDTVCAKGGKDTVKGGGGKDKLYGQGGADKLVGGGGNDKLVGGGGGDKLLGKGGNDTCVGGAGKDIEKSC
ncbi:MAG: choice-of-anchor Q domain-containing protein [Actinomycetota bacterium]